MGFTRTLAVAAVTVSKGPRVRLGIVCALSVAFLAGGPLASLAQTPSPLCLEVSEDEQCWQKASNRPGCYLLRPPNNPLDREVLWSGKCEKGKPDGAGIEIWYYNIGDKWKVSTYRDGRYDYGKRSGRWVVRHASGEVHEGPFIDGFRYGGWVERGTKDTSEGTYVRGKRNGFWVSHYPNGEYEQGRLVDDKKEGIWYMYNANGVCKFSQEFTAGHGGWKEDC